MLNHFYKKIESFKGVIMEAAHIQKNDFNKGNVQKCVQVRMQGNAKSRPYQFISDHQ